MAGQQQAEAKKGRPAVKFTLDGETFKTQDRRLTAGAVLGLAGKDPAAYYLVEILGRRKRREYRDPSEEVKLREGSKFVTVSTGPTTVS